MNPIAMSLEVFVGTSGGHILKVTAAGTVLLCLHAPDDAPVYSLCTHPTLPLVFSAHGNGYIRAFDIASGACAAVVAARGSLA